MCAQGPVVFSRYDSTDLKRGSFFARNFIKTEKRTGGEMVVRVTGCVSRFSKAFTDRKGFSFCTLFSTRVGRWLNAPCVVLKPSVRFTTLCARRMKSPAVPRQQRNYTRKRLPWPLLRTGFGGATGWEGGGGEMFPARPVDVN